MCDCQKFTLPAGTICQRNGIPFALVEDTQISTHPDNMPLIVEDEPCGLGVSGDTQTSAFSRCTAENPCNSHACARCNPAGVGCCATPT